MVGYGPLPSETVALVRETCDIVLTGNHDAAVCGRCDPSWFVDLAKDAVKRHRAELSTGDLDWLRALPYACSLDGAVAAHGDLVNPPRFFYILDEKGAAANFAATDAQLMFVGHTHEAALYLTGRSGAVYKTAPQDFVLEDNKRYIVNPGSVGFPRDMGGQCLSSYVLYDSAERSVVFRWLPFEVASVMQRESSPPSGGRRRVAALAAAAVATALALAFLVAWLCVGGLSGERPIVEKTLALLPDMGKVAANVSLEQGSAPAELRIVFEAPSGDVLDRATIVIRQSSRKGFKVPPGAVRARFTLYAVRKGDSPCVNVFLPSGVSQ